MASHAATTPQLPLEAEVVVEALVVALVLVAADVVVPTEVVDAPAFVVEATEVVGTEVPPLDKALLIEAAKLPLALWNQSA